MKGVRGKPSLDKGIRGKYKGAKGRAFFSMGFRGKYKGSRGIPMGFRGKYKGSRGIPMGLGVIKGTLPFGREIGVDIRNMG